LSGQKAMSDPTPQNNANGRVAILLGGRTPLKASPPIIPGGGPVPPPPIPPVTGASVAIVPNIAARNAITPLVLGMLVYVLDNGDGEWALYTLSSLTPVTWTLITNEDISESESNTFEVVVNYNSPNINLLGDPIFTGHRIVNVSVDVTVAFNAAGALLSVGDSGDNARYMDSSLIDLASTGDYQTDPDYVMTADTQTAAYLTPGSGGTQGQAVVLVTFA
jgi:hypothetical protein